MCPRTEVVIRSPLQYQAEDPVDKIMGKFALANDLRQLSPIKIRLNIVHGRSYYGYKILIILIRFALVLFLMLNVLKYRQPSYIYFE